MISKYATATDQNIHNELLDRIGNQSINQSDFCIEDEVLCTSASVSRLMDTGKLAQISNVVVNQQVYLPWQDPVTNWYYRSKFISDLSMSGTGVSYFCPLRHHNGACCDIVRIHFNLKFRHMQNSAVCSSGP